MKTVTLLIAGHLFLTGGLLRGATQDCEQWRSTIVGIELCTPRGWSVQEFPHYVFLCNGQPPTKCVSGTGGLPADGFANVKILGSSPKSVMDAEGLGPAGVAV